MAPLGTDLTRGEERLERTGRWDGIYGLALAATAVGILVGTPVAILAGLAGVGYAAFSRVMDAPAPELAVERHVSDTDPDPGDPVRVTLTVAIVTAGVGYVLFETVPSGGSVGVVALLLGGVVLVWLLRD